MPMQFPRGCKRECLPRAAIRSIRICPAANGTTTDSKEGLPRLLEVFDRRKVKVTSHMGRVQPWTYTRHSQKEIVQRGHEAAGHGQTWTAQVSLTS